MTLHIGIVHTKKKKGKERERARETTHVALMIILAFATTCEEIVSVTA
jgi:hypothetical protein